MMITRRIKLRLPIYLWFKTKALYENGEEKEREKENIWRQEGDKEWRWEEEKENKAGEKKTTKNPREVGITDEETNKN